MKRILKILSTIILLLAICGAVFFGYKYYSVDKLYRDSRAKQDELKELYQPVYQDGGSEETDLISENFEEMFVDYKDARAWITIDDTLMDYPVFQSEDNDYYLHRDPDGNYLYAGVIFADYRCSMENRFENLIIYGHHIKDGSMFAGLVKYGDKEYFDSHRDGKLFFRSKVYKIKLFSYIVARNNDEVIYNLTKTREDYLDYLEKNSVFYDKPEELLMNERLIILSTCNYSFKNARSVVVGYLYR